MIDIEEHLSGLSDEQLTAALETAKADLDAAATAEPNSVWHEACFAGVLMYAQEMNKRGLRASALH